MRIDISRIIKHNGASVDVNFEQVIELPNSQVQILKPVQVIGKIINIGEIFVFEGSILFKYKVFCDRCLEEIESNLSIDIDEKFIYGKISQLDDINVFHGSSIELTDVIKNNIILNLPIQFLCKEECSGLCPICGINRNIKECNCREDSTDIRLEKLKNLLNLK